jgi:hypothetical protein
MRRRVERAQTIKRPVDPVRFGVARVRTRVGASRIGRRSPPN